MDSVSASRRSLASFAEEIHSRKGNFSLTAESNSQVEITFVKCPRKSKFLNALLGSEVTITVRNGAVGSDVQMKEIKTSTRRLGKDLAELEKQLKQQGVGEELSWSEKRPDHKASLSNLDIDSIESLLPDGSGSVPEEYIEVDDVGSFSSDDEIKDRQNDPSAPQKQAAFLRPGQNRGKVSTFDPDDVEYPTNSVPKSDLNEGSIDSILGEDPINSPEKLEQDKKAAADFLEKLNNGADLWDPSVFPCGEHIALKGSIFLEGA